jgi:hypothetical protein
MGGAAMVRPAARSAVVALGILMVADVFRTCMAIGHYEFRITVVTHGEPDVWVAALAYELFDRVVDEFGWALGFRVAATSVATFLWTLALLVTVVTVVLWLRRSRLMRHLDRVTLGWLGAAVLLKVLSAIYDTVAAPPSPVVGGVLTTRPVAYPLWILSTVVLGVAAGRVVRAIRSTAAEPGSVVTGPAVAG